MNARGIFLILVALVAVVMLVLQLQFMLATRLSACNDNAWPRPDDDDAIPTSRALLPSAALVGSEPTATGACALRRPSVRRESSLSLEGQQAAAAAAAAAAVGTLLFQSPLLL